MLSFNEAIKAYYRRYVDFEGRSQRSEYWWFQLYFAGILILLFIVTFALGMDWETEDMNGVGMAGFGVLVIFALAHVIGNISLAVRRFHDLGQTGWLVLVFAIAGVIPLVGTLASIGQLIWFCLRGTMGPNQYGPDPLDPQADVFN